ncbi:MAG: hypothetical protein IPK82_03040 [Polyangiaceae bacterium]|nr:hypothetical protein [Polyangiaceae bacterium]
MGCLLIAAFTAFGCSLGSGEGQVHSDALYAKDCIYPSQGPACEYQTANGQVAYDEGCDNYDLLPDFFAAVPSEDTIQMRIQRGTDLTELSDGLAVLVTDVNAIRDAIKAKRDEAIKNGATEDEALETYVEVPVAIPYGVQPPGAPDPSPPPCDATTQLCTVNPVAIALYLQKSCHNQNTVLYAVGGFIRFSSLFSGDPVESSAAEKLNHAPYFEVIIGDPRNAPPGVPIGPDSIPPEFSSKLTGNFRFYFERGKPAQPF